VQRLARPRLEDLTVPLPPDQKTRVIELTAGPMDLQTDATTSFNYVDTEVEVDGENVESVQILTVTWNRSPFHSWAVFALWQNKGRSWSTPVQLTSDLQADGETIETEVSTLTDLGARKLRFQLGAKNSSGVVRNYGTIRAWALIRYRS
jgi:hypothetical protein